MATYDSNGNPVREMYSRDVFSDAVGALGAKFKASTQAAPGYEAPDAPEGSAVIPNFLRRAARSTIDYLGANEAKDRDAEIAGRVGPPVVAAAPAARTVAAPKPVVAAPAPSMRKAAAPQRPASPTATTDGPPVVPQGVMTPMAPWEDGGYGEISGDPSTRIYAEKATPEMIAAANATTPTSAVRDTTYDPGSQGEWARTEGARRMLSATGGSRGLTAMAAYDTAQSAPGIAANTAQATLTKQLLDNQGKLAEAQTKGYYDINGKWVEAGSREKVANITGEASKASAMITGEYGLGRERIAGTSRENVAKIEGPFRVTAAKEGSTNKGEVTPALEFTTMAESLKEKRKALEARMVTKKNAAQHAKDLAALEEDETLLYGRKSTTKDVLRKAH